MGLGGYALYENGVANDKYKKAKALVGPDGALIDPSYKEPYESLRRDGNRARQNAAIGGVGAGVALAVTAVVGYLGYRESGKFGEIRF